MTRSPQPSSSQTASASSRAECSNGARVDARAIARGVDPRELSAREVSARDIEAYALDRSLHDSMRQLADEQGRERYRFQELLGSLGFALRAFDNLDRVLELIPLVATRLTDADGSALILFDTDGAVRVGKVYCADAAECDRVRAALEEATRSLAATAPLPHPETGASPRPSTLAVSNSAEARSDIQQLDTQLSQNLGVETQLFSTPVLMRQAERGRLYVFSRQRAYAWNDGHQKALRLVADHAAVALERAELKSELERRVRLAKEVEIGSEIQSRLQPSQCPHIPGTSLAASSRSASQVGGDYYDFIAIPGQSSRVEHSVGKSQSTPEGESISAGETSPECDRWGIAIGDVMGKGVPAGLLMMATRGALRSEVLNGRDPAQILRHLNRVMLSDMENSSRFVSLFYSDYCPQTRQLCFGNAAHNPPLWYCSHTGKVTTLDTQGMLIGLTADSQYEAKCVRLDPGDLVVYYTDGITEATNGEGDRFEAEGLIAALERLAPHCAEAPQILNELFASVSAFQGRSGHLHHRDDMTLVILKILPES
ncbi:MAG: GAF domain-containing SpoIIE family protein phosphatase [Cyanobacteria bacterium J06639_1]